MILTCAHCNTDFQRRNAQKFCSRACSTANHSAESERVRARCPVCGKKRRPKARGVHCSRACANVTALHEGYWGIPKWDEAFRLRVAQLWSTGMTTVAIGAAMVPQVSKNVIISLAHRMRLPRRASPIKSGGPKPPRLHEKRINQWKPHRTQTLPLFDMASLFGIEAVRKPVPQRRPEPTPPPVPTSPHRVCQWLTTDRRPWVFCGKPAVRGFSWCEEHARRCYTVWPPARRDMLEIAA